MGNASLALGGGIYLSAFNGGTALIERTTIQDNTASNPSRVKGAAGALYAQGIDLAVKESTISGNQAWTEAGVWVGATTNAAGSAYFENVTIAENRVFFAEPADKSGVGGGVWIDGATRGHFVNCTIARNVSGFGSGIVNVASVTLDNTIVMNDATNLFNHINCINMPMDQAGRADGEHNLQWPESNLNGAEWACAVGTAFGDPLLEPNLADAGGPTRTLAPMALSPALARGANCPRTDQRGKARKTPCTLGAFESD